MPKDKPSSRFVMDTASFVSVWRNHINNPDKDEWRKFVLNCFDRFTGGTEFKNKSMLQSHDAKWTKWSEDEKYGFLSDKCYSKCISIKRRLKEEQDYDVSLPSGYLTRNGSGSGKRITSEGIKGLFEGL